MHRVTWWMKLYGGPTPKRHLAYSTSPAIRHLDLGKLRGWARKVRAEDAAGIPRTKTVKKYKDGKGKLRFKGDVGLRPVSQILIWQRKQIAKLNLTHGYAANSFQALLYRHPIRAPSSSQELPCCFWQQVGHHI